MLHLHHSGFVEGPWVDSIDVRDFIQKNYNPYHGDAAFLKGSTEHTNNLMKTVQLLFEEERRNNVIYSEV